LNEDVTDSLNNLLSGGIDLLGGTLVNAGAYSINRDVYPYVYGAPGYGYPYGAGAAPAGLAGGGLGGLLLLGGVAWLIWGRK
jgi:hypothetical protein